MRRVPVDSSVIATVGYDPDDRILEVEFRTGRLYHYFDVPASRYAALMAAESIGHYFNVAIRDKYRFVELGTPT